MRSRSCSASTPRSSDVIDLALQLQDEGRRPLESGRRNRTPSEDKKGTVADRALGGTPNPPLPLFPVTAPLGEDPPDGNSIRGSTAVSPQRELTDLLDAIPPLRARVLERLRGGCHGSRRSPRSVTTLCHDSMQLETTVSSVKAGEGQGEFHRPTDRRRRVDRDRRMAGRRQERIPPFVRPTFRWHVDA